MSTALWYGAAALFGFVIGGLLWLAVREYWHMDREVQRLKMQDQQTEVRRRQLSAMQQMLDAQAKRGYDGTHAFDRTSRSGPTPLRKESK